LIGNATEKSENYDLMSVVTICLGKPDAENYTGILKFLDVLLSSSRAAAEKKKILEEEFGVAMSEELEREVLIMCNLSQGVKAEGREEGIGIGREEGIGIGEMRMLMRLVQEGDLKPERAAEKANMRVEEFKKAMENTPLQAV
jgi:predicted transposase YdaD